MSGGQISEDGMKAIKCVVVGDGAVGKVSKGLFFRAFC